MTTCNCRFCWHEKNLQWLVGRAFHAFQCVNIIVIGKMLVPLGWYPSCLSPPRSPLKGDIPNKYPLFKVYMGLIIKGTIPRVPPFSM